MMVNESSAFIRPTILETAELAYRITAQDWSELNSDQLGQDKKKRSRSIDDQIDVFAENILALLLIRVIAVLYKRSVTPDLPNFRDLSTTTICRTIMADEARRTEDKALANVMNPLDWPEVLTDEIICQLNTYVFKILKLYRNVFYHNCEHAHHVFMNANKLLDSLLCEHSWASLKSNNFGTNQPKNNTSMFGGNKNVKNTRNKILILESRPKRRKPTYGLRSDPDIHFGFLFSALVHDVDHKGVTNKQLVTESDELAIMYNDQSVAEQRSLAIAFTLLMKDDFQKLRDLMFLDRHELHRFRTNVIDLVLCTDISSPERVQILKSKWVEAFGTGDQPTKSEVKVAMKKLLKTSFGNKFQSDDEKDFLETPMCIFLASHKPNAFVDVEDIEAGIVDVDFTGSNRKNTELKEKEIEKIVDTFVGNLNHPKQRRDSLLMNSPSSILGIRKALDRTGDIIDAYEDNSLSSTSDPDLPNSLKAIVILELMLNTADIGANMQKWSTMLKWSCNLFDELKTSFVAGRGADPENGWHGHQIGFFDNYVLPLASSITKVDILGEDVTTQLRFHVLENHIRWKDYGTSCVDEMAHPWKQLPAGVFLNKKTASDNNTMDTISIRHLITDLRSGKDATKNEFSGDIVISSDTASMSESERYCSVRMSNKFDEIEVDCTFYIDRDAINGLQFVTVCYLMFMQIGSKKSWGSFSNLHTIPLHEHLFFLLCGYKLTISMNPIIVKKSKYVISRVKAIYPVYVIATLFGLINLLTVCRPSTFEELFHWGAQRTNSYQDGSAADLFCEGTPTITNSYWGNFFTTILISLLGLTATPLWTMSWFVGYPFWFSSVYFQCLAIFPITYNRFLNVRKKKTLLMKTIVGLYFLSCLIVFISWLVILYIDGKDHNHSDISGLDQDLSDTGSFSNVWILHFFLFGPFWVLYFVIGISLAFIYDASKPANTHNKRRWGWIADICTLLVVGTGIIAINQGPGSSWFLQPLITKEIHHNNQVAIRFWHSLEARLACPLTTLWVFALSTGEGFTAMTLKGKFLKEYLSPNSFACILYYQMVLQCYFLVTRGEHWNYWGFREKFYWFNPKPCPVEWYEFPLIIGLTISFSQLIEGVILPLFTKIKGMFTSNKKKDDEA